MWKHRHRLMMHQDSLTISRLHSQLDQAILQAYLDHTPHPPTHLARWFSRSYASLISESLDFKQQWLEMIKTITTTHHTWSLCIHLFPLFHFGSFFWFLIKTVTSKLFHVSEKACSMCGASIGNSQGSAHNTINHWVIIIILQLIQSTWSSIHWSHVCMSLLFWVRDLITSSWPWVNSLRCGTCTVYSIEEWNHHNCSKHSLLAWRRK